MSADPVDPDDPVDLDDPLDLEEDERLDASRADERPGPPPGSAVALRGLTKRFGSSRGGVTAVDGLDLDVAEGERFGFLGPNGSGKTTTVRMMLGLVLPTSGRAWLLGERVPGRLPQVLADVGAVVESVAAYPHLSARTNLTLLDASAPGPAGQRGRRSRRARVDAALEAVGLDGVGRRRVGAFSLGMRQRLGLAATLVRRPRLLVLDEPTNGLDPQGIRAVTDLLLELNADGTTLFLSSHLLAEVEELCTRVGVMDRGSLAVVGDVADLRAPTGRLLLRVDAPGAAAGLLGTTSAAARLGGRLDVRVEGDRLVLTPQSASGSPRVELSAVVAALVGEGIAVLEAVPERSTLEDVVLARTRAVGER